MHADWYLIQLTSDLRRHEPRNIGVVLNAGGAWHMRFRGVDKAGHVDGRLVRALGVSKETYASWVDYFRRKALMGEWDEALKVSIRRPSNFGVVRGGTLLEATGDWRFTTDRLFADLISLPEKTVKAPIDLARSLFARAQVIATENISLPGRWDDGGRQVSIPFAFGIGQKNGVTLDALSPNPMAVSSLKARLDAVSRVRRTDKFIALVPLSRVDGDVDELLRPVERNALIVDLDSFSAPDDLLQKLSA